MEFFCPSCGNANRTNLPPGNAKKKVCSSCHREFVANDKNRLLSFKNSLPDIKELHVFYRENGRLRFGFGSKREMLIIAVIALIGIFALASAAIYAFF